MTDISLSLRLVAGVLEGVGLHSDITDISRGYIVFTSCDVINASNRLMVKKIYLNSDGCGNFCIVVGGVIILTLSLADPCFSDKVVLAYADTIESFPKFPINLPRMRSMLAAPWFPMAHPNLLYDGRCREDLSDDVQVHDYYGHWTLDELYKYGALPAEEPDILK